MLSIRNRLLNIQNLRLNFWKNNHETKVLIVDFDAQECVRSRLGEPRF